MSPYKLRKSKELKDEFTNLMTTHINFVDSMDEVSAESVRLFHRKKSAVKQVQDYILHATHALKTNNRLYRVAYAKDLHKISGTHGDPRQTNDPTIVNMMNRKVREPPELLFYKGALFEATTNTYQYQNSQVLMMLDVPDESHIRQQKPLVMYAAPENAKVSQALYTFEEPPHEDKLLEDGWKRVKVIVSRGRFVTEANITASRSQYGLRHLGASTVHRTQGKTLFVPSAIEVSFVMRNPKSQQMDGVILY